MVWYGMIWYDMVWYGMIWYDMIWYGMVWYGFDMGYMIYNSYIYVHLFSQQRAATVDAVLVHTFN